MKISKDTLSESPLNLSTPWQLPDRQSYLFESLCVGSKVGTPGAGGGPVPQQSGGQEQGQVQERRPLGGLLQGQLLSWLQPYR